MRLLLSFLLLLMPFTSGHAQDLRTGPAIRYLPDRKLWVLQGDRTTYVLGVNEQNRLQQVYWGGRLWRADDLTAPHTRRDLSSFDPHESLDNEEFPAWGGARFVEPALKVTRDNGGRDVVLAYAAHRINGNSLEIDTRDIRDDLRVTLQYQLEPKTGVLRKQALIVNGTSQPVLLESAQSGVWHVPAGEDYRLSYLTGRWAAETQLTREPIHVGTKVLESRKGHTSHYVNPWFALDEGGQASETHGRVWFGALGWSGNWRLAVEQTPYRQVRITGGLNPFDFGHRLAPGERLQTPPFYGGYTEGGFGEASRLLHQFTREMILPGGLQSRLRPVLYNSWEATQFNVDEAGQRQLAAKAAKLGIELFVMDDGWFGQRNNDKAGLGDWTVNPQKFPRGLQPLIEQVNALGMDFGLWVEPEMINPDSELYRKHPDWVMNFPDRPRTPARNQLVLNMARNDVKEHIFGVLDKLVAENKVRYLKWDMNRPFSEPGWPEAPAGQQKELWERYVLNVYEIIDRLRARHPRLEIESCSGGGGRVDLGILTRTDEVWPSDNTEAYDRLRIQEGFSQAYPAKVMSAWVTDVPNMNGRSTPLQYRFLVAMQGALGIGSNLNKLNEADTALAAKMVGIYKSIRGTVQMGKLYRLLSPREGDLTANEYVSADGKQAALFLFLHSQQYNKPALPVRWRGLDEAATYRVSQPVRNVPVRILSGAMLMQQGVEVGLRGDYDSALVVLERVE